MARWSGVGKMPEYAIQDTLEAQARALGYLYFHDRSAKLNKPGFPDLHVVGYGKHWVIECKKDGEKPTAIQQQWLDAYKLAGVQTRVALPHTYEAIIKEFQDGYQAWVLHGNKT